MKDSKISKTIMSAVLTAILFIVPTAGAKSFKVGDLYYQIYSYPNNAVSVTYETKDGDNYKNLPAHLEIPASVTYQGRNYPVTGIGERAFANCTAIESISIPASVTGLGSGASYISGGYLDNGISPFQDCTSLKYVRIEDGNTPLRVDSYFSTSGGKSIFDSCPIEKVYLGRNIVHINKRPMSQDDENAYKFSSHPEYYGYSLFYGQKNLTSITIGSFVTTYESYAFENCINLRRIVILGKDPLNISTYSNAFSSEIFATAKTYVPFSTLATFQSHAYWKKFKQISEWYNDDFFNYIPISSEECEVSGNNVREIETLTIPERATWNGETHTVSRVAEKGFIGNTSVTSISFPSSLKEIGPCAFTDSPKLTLLNFNSLQTIEYLAFADCPSIINIAFPESLKKIGDGAFQNATGIASISFNESLLEIGNDSFKNCQSLTAIKLPSSLHKIGERAFQDCVKLTYASFGNSLSQIGSSAFQGCGVLTEIEIPGTVESIGNAAFKDCSTLTLATLNSGTLTMGTEVFANCKELLSITIPGTIKSIGAGSFNGCSSLSSVTFSNSESLLSIPDFTDSPLKSLRIGRNLTYTYSNTSSPFYQRITLKRVQFTGDHVTNIYNNLLDGCSGITSITLPESLQTINGYAFRNCSGLPEIILPASLTSIGEHAFDGCVNLSNLTINDSQETLNISTSNAMFQDCPLTSIYMGRNIEYATTNLNCAPFYDHPNLNSVVIAENYVTKLNDGYLQGASKLESITLPESIESIGSYAFANCSSLTEMTMPNAIRTAGAYGFLNCTSLKSIRLSENLTSLESGLLSGCSNVQSIIIPASVSSVGNAVFNDCFALKSVIFIDGSKELAIGYNSTNQGLFNDSPLQSLYLGRNLTYDATSANGFSPFYNKTTLTELSFSQDGTITTLHNYLFAGCSSVKNFRLPESLNSIGNYTFSDMTSLEWCVIPNAVSAVGVGSFKNDVKLADVTLSNQMKALSQEVFFGCTVLDNLTIPSSVTSIDKDAFNCCSNLTNLNIVDGTDIMTVGINTTYGNRSMFADSPIANLYLGRWLTYDISNEKYAPFYGKSTLTHLTLGKTVGTIGKYLFEKCDALESVDIPDGTEAIGEQSFYMCSALKNLSLGEGLTSLGERAFASDVKLDNVRMPSTLNSISDGCFSHCSGLITLDLNDNLEIIGPRSFEYCTALPSISLPTKMYGLGVESFIGCSALNAVSIPDGALKSVGARAFKNCLNIQNVSLGKQVSSLGSGSFDGCNNIRYIKSYNNIPPVGTPLFSDNVLENATAFVPADALAYYQDADVWWEFFRILPIGDMVLVESLSLDRNEGSIKDTETLQLNASVTPSTATDTRVLFRSTDTSVATVNENGVVTPIKVGTAIIKAYAADGSGLYQDFYLTVMPTMIESIEITGDTNSLKKNRTLQLIARATPSNATNTNVIWTSSDNSIVKVEDNGTVSALRTGSVLITAIAADGSDVTGSFALTVIPPTKGDSNDNDQVTITDAVNTANYAIGNEVTDFCFEAADVNGDNRITLADASGTVTEVLNQPAINAAMAVRRMSRGLDTADHDVLNVTDYIIESGKTAALDVKLNNIIDYVALQADIVAPEGMSIVGVEIGERGEANHSLMQRRIDDQTMRIALFDINNMPFDDNDEAVIRIIIKADNSDCGDIVMNNIIASDAEAHEYVLTAVGGHNAGLSGVGSIFGDGSIKIEATDEGIKVYNADGKEVRVYTVDGMLLAKFTATGNMVNRNLSTGVYVVAVDNTTVKVMVK